MGKEGIIGTKIFLIFCLINLEITGSDFIRFLSGNLKNRSEMKKTQSKTGFPIRRSRAIIDVERVGAMHRICLHRPEKRNALKLKIWMASLRLDPLAKGMAQQLLAFPIPIPDEYKL